MANRRTTRFGRRARRKGSLLWVVVVVAVVGAVTVACVPPTAPAKDPNNVANLTDEQVDARLAADLPKIEAAFADPEVIEQIPTEYRDYVQTWVDKLGNADGRQEFIDQMRADALTQRGGFRGKRDTFAGGLLDSVVGLFDSPPVDTSLHGVRYIAPPSTGADVAFAATSGNCGAPGGPGTLPAPSNLVPDQLLTPEHDAFATYVTIGSPTSTTMFTILTATGEPTINGTPGAEFRGTNGSYQMHVQVDVQDVNHGFPVAALRPLFRLRPLGGTPAQETHVQAVDGNIFCYAGDAPESQRAYFDGWIPVPNSDGGYQLIAEVVENDYYFRFGGSHFDFALSAGGPQFFAGADRSTVHIGQGPVTDAQPLLHSVGAFATGELDPGAGAPNVLTDTNGVMTDDVEGPLSGYVSSTVRSALSDGFAGRLVPGTVLLEVQAYLQEPPEATTDVKLVDRAGALPGMLLVPGDNGGYVDVDVTGKAKADIFMSFLGIPCFGVTGEVDLDVRADIFANSAGPGTGIDANFFYSDDSGTNFDMSYFSWLVPSCAVAFGLMKAGAWLTLGSKVESALHGALGEDGALTKILSGFDLNDYLPTFAVDPITLGNTTTGGAAFRPVVTNLDNGWCGATGAPAGCTPDQMLTTPRGVEVTADSTVVSSLAQALGGGPLGGRFPNAYAPYLWTSVDDLVVSHRDAASQQAGLGVVLDPRLVNLALRALAQGTSTTTTTNGLADIQNLTIGGGLSVSTRPEVAPIVTGATTNPAGVVDESSVTAVLPDIRMNLRTSSEDPDGVTFSAAASASVGLAFDPATGQLRPVIQPPVFDLQVTGGCQVNYTSAYATSYQFCGRGAAGNGGTNIASLTDLIDRAANALVKELVLPSIGGITLPTLDALVPRLHLALTNVRFAQRGGYLAAYADIRPAPRIEMKGSTAGYGGDDDTIRFFAVPYNIDPTLPDTTYTWTITDGVSGKAVSFVGYPGTNGAGIQFPSSAFTSADNPERTKTVKGTVVFKQPGLQITADGSFSWAKATPVPPPNCPSKPPPTPALQIGGGGTLPGNTPTTYPC